MENISSELLYRRLLEAERELYKRTGHGILFSEGLEEFVREGTQVFLKTGVVSERAVKSIMRLWYQSWVGLSLILMLDPSNFSLVSENFEIFKAGTNLPFFREKMRPTGRGESPNFLFFSKLLEAWIGFGFEASTDQWSLRPDIRLNKGKDPIEVRFLVNLRSGVSPKHIIVDTKEENVWSVRKRKGKMELDVLKDYVARFEPKFLYVVCYEKEDDLTIFHPKIKILNGVDFDREKLMPIVEELRLI